VRGGIINRNLPQLPIPAHRTIPRCRSPMIHCRELLLLAIFIVLLPAVTEAGIKFWNKTNAADCDPANPWKTMRGGFHMTLDLPKNYRKGNGMNSRTGSKNVEFTAGSDGSVLRVKGPNGRWRNTPHPAPRQRGGEKVQHLHIPVRFETVFVYVCYPKIKKSLLLVRLEILKARPMLHA